MELVLSKQNVLRYLGYKKSKQTISPDLDRLIEETMEECLRIAQPKFVYRIFPYKVIAEPPTIQLAGTNLQLPGKAICRHLRGAEQVVLMAATLGIQVERQTRIYEYQELTKALVFDAAATDMIEQVCDAAEQEIQHVVSEQKLYLNRRFSPGYGDLSLEVQPKFLATLEAEKRIGLSCSDSLIMIPRKSVSAVIGLFTEEKKKRKGKRKSNCDDCSKQADCQYQEEK